MKVFGMCIDKRVVAGVITAGVLLWWLAPGAFAAALPLLIFAICPLSMLVMMKAMNQMGGEKQPVAPTPAVDAASADDIAAVSAAAADLDARRN